MAVSDGEVDFKNAIPQDYFRDAVCVLRCFSSNPGTDPGADSGDSSGEL